MATIVTRDTGATAVNRPLTNAEIDANFINLNDAIASSGGGSGGSFTTYTRTAIVATAGQTTFTATYTIGYLQVYVNGVLLNPADYTALTGTSLTLATSTVAEDIVEIISFTISGSGGNTNIDGGIPSSTYTVSTQTISGGTPSNSLVNSDAPVNIVAPTVTYSALAAGMFFTANEGTWTGTPTPTYTYQWQRYDGSQYTNISGATFFRYGSATTDVNIALACIVTATNTAGTTSVRTTPTATITQVLPGNTVAPTITGSARVGQTLTVNAGTWTGTPTPTFTYRWYNSSAYVIIGTSSTYTVASSDIGYIIYCVVTANNNTSNVSALSADTSVVVA
jgi:hypothetical protein